MIDCDTISRALAEYDSCQITDRGVQIKTQCLYPSFERVEVCVVGFGGGFLIHDSGDAVRTAWEHARDHASINRKLSSVVKSFSCEFKGEQFRVTVESLDRLNIGIIAVSNASAEGAKAVLSKQRALSERRIIDKVKSVFDEAPWRPKTKTDHQVNGKSGRQYTFDLAVFHGDQIALIDAVSNHANSIASKYLAFSDTEKRPGAYKYAVYDGDLSSQDKALLVNVADPMRLSAIVGTNGKHLLEKHAA